MLPRHFRLIYSLKIELKEKNNNLEEYLLTTLPLEIWEKVNYNSEKQVLSSSDKEMINGIKKAIKENPQISITEEKVF